MNRWSYEFRIEVVLVQTSSYCSKPLSYCYLCFIIFFLVFKALLSSKDSFPDFFDYCKLFVAEIAILYLESCCCLVSLWKYLSTLTEKTEVYVFQKFWCIFFVFSLKNSILFDALKILR